MILTQNGVSFLLCFCSKEDYSRQSGCGYQKTDHKSPMKHPWYICHQEGQIMYSTVILVNNTRIGYVCNEDIPPIHC